MMMRWLRNLAFYPAFYGGSLFLVLGAVLAIPFGREALRRMVGHWSGWHRRCVTGILGIEIRLDNEPAQQPVLYAMKHESFFEAIDGPTLFENPAVFTKAELFRIPGWGRSALAYGLIPVARDQGARTLRHMIAEAQKHVTDGRPLVIFPEGTRVPHGESPKLQAGFAGLYKLLGLAVVPVAVDSGPLYHRGMKRAGTITYRFGDVIPAGLPRAEAEARVHKAINGLNRATSPKT